MPEIDFEADGKVVSNIGELKAAIAELPDEFPLGGFDTAGMRLGLGTEGGNSYLAIEEIFDDDYEDDDGLDDEPDDDDFDDDEEDDEDEI